MKRFLVGSIIVAGAVGLGWWIGATRSAEQLAVWRAKEAAWLSEKDRLTSELAKVPSRDGSKRDVVTSTQTITVEKKQSAEEIIETLKTLRVAGRQTRNVRLAIQQFENLINLGPEALPAIQGFLSQQQDIEYDASIFGAWKGSKDGNVPVDFVFPPSLRFGLFDVVRQIGGGTAEDILSETLRVTGRGVEVAYLTRVLQQLAPFRYRDLAVSAAKELLTSPSTAASTSALDKYERNYLFGVLAFYNDASLAPQAQAALIQGTGKIDLGALQYLQKTLGTQSLATVAQVYQDNRVNDGKQKEPLARVALNFAGGDTQADALWHTAITDQSIPTDARRELIEDLNQDGLENLKQPTTRDLRLIQNRIALIEKFQHEADSKAIADAFAEAYKDLLEMQAKAQPKPFTK